MQKFSKNKIFLPLSLIIFLAPFFAAAVNDVSISGTATFELLTADTAVTTTVTANDGGQVTNFDVQADYIDIAIDNLSTVTFNIVNAGEFLRITKQSGSNAFTITPSCPTTTATITGAGAQVILRLEVFTTDNCPSGGDGGGGGGRSSSGGFLPIQRNGVCGPANAGTYSTTDQFSGLLCQAGTASNIIFASNRWNWFCFSAGGGANAACYANYAPDIVPPPPPSAACSAYITKSIRQNQTNDPAEVKKLQTFLREFEGFTTLPSTGYFGPLTDKTAKEFQARYAKDILAPLGRSTPTGYVFSMTIKKINEIYCRGQ